RVAMDLSSTVVKSCGALRLLGSDPETILSIQDWLDNPAGSITGAVCVTSVFGAMLGSVLLLRYSIRKGVAIWSEAGDQYVGDNFWVKTARSLAEFLGIESWLPEGFMEDDSIADLVERPSFPPEE